jgi:hypothetical protein
MFKFYNIPNIKTLEDIVGDNPTIKFSSPFNLNDPFELKFNVKLDPYAEGHLELYQQAHPNCTKDDFLNWQRQVENNYGYINQVENTTRIEIARMITLCSFSQNCNNNLMWSHYAGNHSGICVEYLEDLTSHFKTNSSFFAATSVQYSECPPSIDIFENNASKIFKMIFNKQSEWKYEQEYRIVILSNNEFDKIPIDRKFIKAIYVGSNASDEITKRIVEIGRSNKIEVHYAITIGKTYEVHFAKHRDGTMHMRGIW